MQDISQRCVRGVTIESPYRAVVFTADNTQKSAKASHSNLNHLPFATVSFHGVDSLPTTSYPEHSQAVAVTNEPAVSMHEQVTL